MLLLPLLCLMQMEIQGFAFRRAHKLAVKVIQKLALRRMLEHVHRRVQGVL